MTDGGRLIRQIFDSFRYTLYAECPVFAEKLVPLQLSGANDTTKKEAKNMHATINITFYGFKLYCVALYSPF